MIIFSFVLFLFVSQYLSKQNPSQLTPKEIIVNIKMKHESIEILSICCQCNKYAFKDKGNPLRYKGLVLSNHIWKFITFV